MSNASRTTGVIVVGVMLLGATTAGAQDWPQRRGPNRDNKVTGFAAPKAWPKELHKKWSVPVGIGESSPVLMGDKLYVFSRQGGDEVTLCLDAGSGKEVWKDKYAAEAVRGPAGGYPGPRSTPAVGEGKVCTLGVGGVVSCLDTANGKVAWRKNTGTKPKFYTSTSPMIVDGKCIVFDDGLTAYDLATGAVQWQWTGAKAPYGSPVLMTVGGTRQVVTPAAGVLAGVSLADGKPLWQVKIGSGGFDYQSNYSTPLVAGDTVIYSMSAKKSGGSMMALKIEKKSDGFTATEIWKKGFAAAGYHTPLLRDGLVYGVLSAGRNFFCLDAKSGERLWTDSAQRGQCGCILDAGDVLLALSSDKELIAMRPSNKAYSELAKYQVAQAETWTVPVVAGNRVFVKDKAGSLTLWTLD